MKTCSGLFSLNNIFLKAPPPAAWGDCIRQMLAQELASRNWGQRKMSKVKQYESPFCCSKVKRQPQESVVNHLTGFSKR